MAEAASDMGVEEFDTRHRDLRALGHRLERLERLDRLDADAGAGTDAPVVWRLTLARPGPGATRTDAPVDGLIDGRIDGLIDGRIDVVGPPDGTVPPVLVALLAGVTGGGALEVVDTDRPDRSPRAPRSVAVVRGVGRQIPADVDVGHLVRAMASRAVRTIVGLDPHLRLDAMPDDVHDARVAARRLRSELHELAHVLRVSRSERLRAELAWYGEVLGAVRDLDVLLDHVDDELPRDDAGARLVRLRVRNQRRVAALVLRNALASVRMRRLYDELIDLVADPWFAKGIDPDRRARRVALDAVRSADRRLARSVRAIGDPPEPELLHEVRKRAKACRYVCELVAEPVGSGRLAVATKALQSTLGSLQDAATIDAWLSGPHRPLLEPAAVEAVAVIAEHVAQQRDRALAAWPSAWVRVQADALRPWLG